MRTSPLGSLISASDSLSDLDDLSGEKLNSNNQKNLIIYNFFFIILLFFKLVFTAVLLVDDKGFEFSLIFLHWNRIKFHIIQAWTSNEPPKHVNLTRGVLKLPASISIESTLELLKPNLCLLEYLIMKIMSILLFK